jgi:hypothetical protein
LSQQAASPDFLPDFLNDLFEKAKGQRPNGFTRNH